MFALNDELNVLFKGLSRDDHGNLRQTAPRSAGYQAGPQSQVDVANRAKVHAQRLSTAAVKAKADGLLVEGRILQNQSDYELAALAKEMASRSVDRANDDERCKEAEERRDAAHAEMERLQDEARELDKKYAEKAAQERRQNNQGAEQRNDRQAEHRSELAERQAKVKREFGNAFREQRAGEKLRALKECNERVDLSQVEAADPRLGRRQDGTLDGKYIENSADTKGHRRDMRDYVKDLQDEAHGWQLKGNDVVAERYRVQAEKESAQVRNRGQDAARDEPRIRKANEDLALADMRDRGPHMKTAEQRLADNTGRPKSEWVRDTYKTSELRAGLRPELQSSYDHYRSRVAEQVAEKQGVDPKGYQLTQDEVARFDKAFSSDATEAKRTHEVARQEQRRNECLTRRGSAPRPEMQRQDTQREQQREPVKELMQLQPTESVRQLVHERNESRLQNRQAAEAKLSHEREALQNPQKLNANEKRAVELQTGKPVPREVEGHRAERSRDLTQVKYIRERDQVHTMTDLGKMVRVEKDHKYDMDTIKSGLSLADSKFNSIGVRSKDEKFRALTAKAAVEMGLDSKIKSQDMAPFLEEARNERKAEQRKTNEKASEQKRAPEQRPVRQEPERAPEKAPDQTNDKAQQPPAPNQEQAAEPAARSRPWASMASAARERESGMEKPVAEKAQDKPVAKDAQQEVALEVQKASGQREPEQAAEKAEKAPEQQKEAGRVARPWAAQASSARERETDIATAQPRTRSEDEELSR